MVKPVITHLNKASSSVYLKVKAQKDIVNVLESFMSDLGLHWHGLIEEDYLFDKLDNYFFVENKDFTVHVIKERPNSLEFINLSGYLHLVIIIKTNLVKKLNDAITKEFEIASKS